MAKGSTANNFDSGPPLGAQDVFSKDLNKVLHCHVLGIPAAAFLLVVFLQYFLCVQGRDGIKFTFWFLTGSEGINMVPEEKVGTVVPRPKVPTS